MTTRAQVTFASISGFPEDATVNTFHFGSIVQAPYAPGVVTGILESFYNDLHGTQNHSLTAHMSESVDRTTPATIKLYDLNDEEPRVPYESETFTPDNPHGTSNLPAETALCLSWKAAAVSGVPLGRLRGRTFIGPLLADAGDLTTGIVRPTAALQQDLQQAGEYLIGAGAADLVIYSSVLGVNNAWPVVGGYVDNAFDTIRSRGPAPTSRLILTP